MLARKHMDLRVKPHGGLLVIDKYQRPNMVGIHSWLPCQMVRIGDGIQGRWLL